MEQPTPKVEAQTEGEHSSRSVAFEHASGSSSSCSCSSCSSSEVEEQKVQVVVEKVEKDVFTKVPEKKSPMLNFAAYMD